MIDAALRRDALVVIDATAAALDHADDADAQPTVATRAASELLTIVMATLIPAGERLGDLLADLRRHIEADTNA